MIRDNIQISVAKNRIKATNHQFYILESYGNY